MDFINKKICLNNYICRINPYLINGVVPDNTITTGSTSHWGEITGLTNNNEIEYYTKTNTIYTSSLCSFNILFTQNFDDIGVAETKIENWVKNKIYFLGEVVLYNGYSFRCYINKSKSDMFSLNDWELNSGDKLTDNTGNTVTNTVTFIGESKINEFRRYSKTTNDEDLYNPIWNSGFTQEIKNAYGNINKIISESFNNNGLKQNLYEYIIGATENHINDTGIHYKDISDGISEITYITSGLTQENSISAPSIKEDYLLGVIESPKISVDVFIDRGVNSTFDKNLKLGDIRSLDGLVNYGNGFFKIKSN